MKDCVVERKKHLKMYHLSFVFCVVLFMLVLFSGCSNKFPIVLESNIKDDLLASSALEYYSSYNLVFQEFNIEKRQTSETDKLDRVFVEATLNDAEGIFEIEGSYVMTYGLYNEGWLCDNVEITENRVSPLVGTDHNEESLCQILRTAGYESAENISIYSP